MKEILVAGRQNVAVTRSVDEVRLSWRAPRVSARPRSAAIIGLVLAASGSLVGFPFLLDSVLDGSSAALVILGAALTLAAAMIGGAAFVGGVVERTARLSSAGVSVNGGEAVPLSANTEVRLLIQDRGELGLVEDAVVEAIAAKDTATARASGQARTFCAVHVVVDGEHVPVARDLLPEQALAIVRVLREHLRPGPPGEVDAEALDELDRMRRVRKAEAR